MQSESNTVLVTLSDVVQRPKKTVKMVELSALIHGFTCLYPVFGYGDSEPVVTQSIMVGRASWWGALIGATNLKEDGKQSERR